MRNHYNVALFYIIILLYMLNISKLPFMMLLYESLGHFVLLHLLTCTQPYCNVIIDSFSTVAHNLKN
jgi:hypothetical protein